MTTKRKERTPAPVRSSPLNDFKGFANIELPTSAKDVILDHAEQTNAMYTAVSGLLEAGFKVSFSPPDDNDCITCTATGTKASGPSQGYAVSARSEDEIRAVVALSFKVFDVADCDLSQFASTRNSKAEI